MTEQTAGAEVNSAPALFAVGSVKAWCRVLCQLITPLESPLILRGDVAGAARACGAGQEALCYRALLQWLMRASHDSPT